MKFLLGKRLGFGVRLSQSANHEMILHIKVRVVAASRKAFFTQPAGQCAGCSGFSVGLQQSLDTAV